MTHLHTDMPVDLFEDDDILFHYTSSHTAINHILKDKCIRFTPFGQLKDPRESKPWSFGLLRSGPKDHAIMHKEVNTVFNDFIKKKCKILCLCSKSNEEINIEGNLIPVFRKADYTAGFTKSRMWAQYADDHKGVCLAFSRASLNSELEVSYPNHKIYSGLMEYQYYLISFVKAKKVDFISLIRSGGKEIVKDHIQSYHHEYFFLKLKDYERENEYRFVLVSDNDDYAYLPIESSLKAIILGIDFPKRNYKDIVELANSFNRKLELWVLDWQEGRPQLFHLCEKYKPRDKRIKSALRRSFFDSG